MRNKMSMSQRHQHSTRPTPRAALISFLGGFVSIGAIGLFDQFVLQDNDLAFLIGAFGATAVLVFGVPGSPFAQPWNVLVGHVISAIIGVAVLQIVGPGWLAAALAVSLAVVAMQMSHSVHPPGGASALIAVAGSQTVHDLGFLYPLFPVGAGAVVLIAVAYVTNNLSAHRPWPVYWH
jgi:CBS domain-containing membrane protein